ncbi:MAG: Nif3-like dinuclear metal center hexameric protein [Ignavibacteriales bacterium]|nr:Nif3-like dinuclear metal center hexameric protein [Ignavibacteriales bacterium]
MILRNIQKIIENWAPKEIAWERDNIGIQIGSPNSNIDNILVALEITLEVVKEAVRKKADLIITHHPFLYNPLKSINPDTQIGFLISTLLSNKVAVYSAHTNLDFTRNGVSFALAKALGLDGTDFLRKNQQTNKKIVVFVQSDHAKVVLEAMANQGAGVIGEYSSCSFNINGTGTFLPSAKAKPYIGKKGRLESTEEVRLEMNVPQWCLNDVIAAMKEVHPYDEVAFDVYPLSTPSNDYGSGVIGNLPKKLTPDNFLKHCTKKLNTKILRHNNFKRKQIERVAVCGGSGSDLIAIAHQAGADAFVTADISYHRFSDCPPEMLLVDAGHFETEEFIVRELVNFLKREMKKQNSDIKIFGSLKSINPIHYYTS